ncbi:MAG TPA: DegT/DnrJ/EryC1/StrS family aminotransferase [Desulfomonilaceae bacterium]|nr:DegT/DnrJ/EryC1/StrS family aminotransferase [Desulfomonilaceae bacterium]
MKNKPGILSHKPLFPEFVPIVRPCLPEFGLLAADVERMLATGVLTKGPHLEQFETKSAAHLQVDHAVGVSSCTVGLMLTYLGMGLTGDVVVPSFTFMATVSSLVLAGLRPVFADVSRDSTNLDPVAVEEAITPRTSAIVAVHNFGNPAEISSLEEIAAKRGLKLIFDAAHGFGSLHRGTPLGGQGDAHVFSLSPTKLVTGGEGGLVATNDWELAERLRIAREYGHSTGYDSAFAGLNGRMAEFNALLALRSLDMLDGVVSHRNILASMYRAELGGVPGIGFQRVHPEDRSCYKDFSVTIDGAGFGMNRDELVRTLAADNIDTRAYYCPAVHAQTAYRSFFRGAQLPNTDFLSARSLSLPMWSHMEPETVSLICLAVKRAHEHAAEIRDLWI